MICILKPRKHESHRNDLEINRNTLWAVPNYRPRTIGTVYTRLPLCRGRAVPVTSIECKGAVDLSEGARLKRQWPTLITHKPIELCVSSSVDTEGIHSPVVVQGDVIAINVDWYLGLVLYLDEGGGGGYGQTASFLPPSN